MLFFSALQATSNATACQLVANLCVLQTYLRSDPACSQSLDLVGPYLPPIFYPERGAVRTLEETSLGTKLSTKGDVDVSNSYSRTSDKGPSERKTASLERDCPKIIFFP